MFSAAIEARRTSVKISVVPRSKEHSQSVILKRHSRKKDISEISIVPCSTELQLHQVVIQRQVIYITRSVKMDIVPRSKEPQLSQIMDQTTSGLIDLFDQRTGH